MAEQLDIVSPYIRNFPFPTLREGQAYVLNEIDSAFASGYKYIILEGPTGFGKSPVGIAVARTLGTSYICTSTKDLQTQYAKDFPFLKVVKGKNNFTCNVKEDFIKNGTYKCGLCLSKNINECHHMAADYGPCINNVLFRHRDCRYRTFSEDYNINNRGPRGEEVFIDNETRNNFQKKYFEWQYLENLKEELRVWRPCEYYHQLNIAIAASHSIFNYSQFLIYTILARNLPSRRLLVLDEAHRLEEEVVKLVGISIPKKKLRYIPDFEIVDHGYEDITKWIEFLRLVVAKISAQFIKLNDEFAAEAATYLDKLVGAIKNISSNPENWIVSEIKREGNEIVRVELKPLDTAPYCSPLFELCDKTLMMSATILDKSAFCSSIGLLPQDVKFIQVGSDFPLQHRTIYPLNVEYLNYKTLNEDRVKQRIAAMVDKIMTFHKNHKGIIHTTSYTQLNFIKENISQENKLRLIETNPEVERVEVIEEHINATKPTVLISPSLHLGLDLKDDLSRFQVITKVPYPSLGDRWIDGKRRKNGQWYNWQTALKLVQGYGRSVRSKDDWATTYVLDDVFRGFVHKNSHILPGWFMEAIRWQ
jgi:ATP-dependent DNA helicase DinG